MPYDAIRRLCEQLEQVVVRQAGRVVRDHGNRYIAIWKDLHGLPQSHVGVDVDWKASSIGRDDVARMVNELSDDAATQIFGLAIRHRLDC